MAGKKITLMEPDGTSVDYTLNPLTLDQAEAALDLNSELAPKQRTRAMLGACLGLDDTHVGALPYVHYKRLLSEALTLNELSQASGADGTPSGESPISAPSERS